VSEIQWTDETWNPTVGCSRVSPGCEHCYAERVASRGMLDAHRGLTKQTSRGPVWTGEVRCLPERLEIPLRWRKPRRVFVDSMSDLFHESVPDSFIDRVFAVMQACPQHVFQVLTKRPERMRSYMEGASERVRDYGEALAADHEWCHAHEDRDWPLSNVQLGTSVEDQPRADERTPHLLATPAAVRFLSLEPLLGPVDVGPWLAGPETVGSCARQWSEEARALVGDMARAWPRIQWLIIGGESGPGARPCEVAWIRSLRDQGREAGVPVFVKQLGSRPITTGAAWSQGKDFPEIRLNEGAWEAVLRNRKGGDPAEWPEDLRVREWPA